MTTVPKLKILAVASSGGHWIQLLRLKSALQGHETVYVTVDPRSAASVPGCRVHLVPDSNQYSKLRVLQGLLAMFWIMLRERPDVIISTGAAPGLLAVVLGKLMGARTLWLDSIANADRLSLSGKLAGRYANLWLTQWPHLAGVDGPSFRGAVL